MGEVFLSGLERQPLLPQAAADDGLAGAELLYGPVPGGQPGQSDADAWQVCCVIFNAICYDDLCFFSKISAWL